GLSLDPPRSRRSGALSVPAAARARVPRVRGRLRARVLGALSVSALAPGGCDRRDGGRRAPRRPGPGCPPTPPGELPGRLRGERRRLDEPRGDELRRT